MKRDVPEHTLYEYQVMEKHRSSTGHKTWHWIHIPEHHLYNAGYINDFNKHRLQKRLKKNNGHIGEYGLDGLAMDTSSNTYHGIQAKLYQVATITSKELGTFRSVVHDRLKIKNNDSKGYLYYTGKLELNLKEDLQNGNAIIPIQFSPLEQQVLHAIVPETDFTLSDLQVRALQSLITGWQHIGYLSMPCGVGKTIVLGHYLKQCFFKSIVILSPLRILAKQTLERIQVFLPTHTPMLVDVDGDLEIEHVKEGLTNTTIMSTTFKSFANLFSQLDMSRTFVVMDESHHLANAILGEENEQLNLQKTIKASQKALLLTGTPTAFMAKNYQEIFYYNIADAIQGGYICDYKIYLPQVCKLNTQIPIELEMVDQPTMLILQALFLVNGMLLYGCRRCIAYLSTIEECGMFNATLQEICARYHTGTDIWKEEITANTTQKRRDEILQTFDKDVSHNLYVVASVRVLDEGVNLVKCDSVFMNTVPNDITFVQRLCRANRKDDFHPNKVASCFLWENDYENAIHLFKYLSKCDPKFSQKLEITRSNYDNTSVEANVQLQQANYDFVQNITIRIMTHTEKWDLNLQEVKAYIDKEKKRPSSISKDEKTKQLGRWISNQQKNYAKQEKIMKDATIRVKWEAFVEEYKVYFLSNEEEWDLNLQEVKAYIDKEKKRPSSISKDEKTKQLGKWISNQQKNYAKRKHIMKEATIRVKWEAFVEDEKYRNLFSRI